MSHFRNLNYGTNKNGIYENELRLKKIPSQCYRPFESTLKQIIKRVQLSDSMKDKKSRKRNCSRRLQGNIDSTHASVVDELKNPLVAGLIILDLVEPQCDLFDTRI